MQIGPEEQSWFAEQRALVEEYLKRQGVEHRGVARFPTFHMYPQLALWAVQSKLQPGSAAWWAISGDMPTDYIPRSPIAAARGALRLFSERWREVADYMKRDESHPHIVIGPRNKWAELAPLLLARGDALLFLAADDALWKEWSKPD